MHLEDFFARSEVKLLAVVELKRRFAPLKHANLLRHLVKGGRDFIARVIPREGFGGETQALKLTQRAGRAECIKLCAKVSERLPTALFVGR